jgi:Outer membrane protein beta-barrel domain
MLLKPLSAILGLFIVTAVHGQRTEILASFNAGLFSFTGSSAAAVSQILHTDLAQDYTNNPYGNKPGFSYGVSATIQRVTRYRLIAGFDLGYELLRSKIGINGVDVAFPMSGYTEYPATGRTYLDYHFINAHPFLGYRLFDRSVKFDLTAGPEFGYCLSAKENGKASAGGATYETSGDRMTIKVDVRQRIQAAAEYRRFGAYIGYSFGIVNYMKGYVGGSDECYARMLRFGLSYRIK